MSAATVLALRRRSANVARLMRILARCTSCLMRSNRACARLSVKQSARSSMPSSNAPLRRALADWYGREWRRTTNNSARAREVFELRERQQSDATRAVSDAEAAMAEAESQLRAARLEAERAAAEQRRRADHVRRLEQERALAEERKRLLTERAAELRRDLSALDRDGAAASHDSNIALDPSLERSLAEAEDALTAARERFAQVDTEQEAIRGRLIEIDEALARLRGAQAEDDTRLSHIGAERERLRSDIAEARRSTLQAELE